MIKLGICNELFEGWDFGRVCRTVKELGYDGLEIAPFTLAPLITDLTAERRRELKAMVEDAGLETIGLHWLLAKTEGFYLTSPDESVRRKTGDYLIALAEATRDLGGTLMVLGSPKQRDLLPGVAYEQACDYAIEVFDASCRASVRSGSISASSRWPERDQFPQHLRPGDGPDPAGRSPHLKLHMDVKAQSSETDSTVPELIRQYARRRRPLPRPGREPARPGMGEVDFGPS